MIWQILSWVWFFVVIGTGAISCVAMWVAGLMGWVGNLSMTVFAAPVVVLFGLLPMAIIASYQSPDLAVLKKGQWECTSSHAEAIPVTTFAGNVAVTTYTYNTVCDQYTKIMGNPKTATTPDEPAS